MKKSTATIFLLAASTIWGISFVVMKGLLDYLPLNHLLAYRFTVAAIGMSFVLVKYRRDITKKAWFHGALVGLCMFFSFEFQTLGLLFIGSGKNALVTAVYVVVVPFLMWLFKKKKPALRSVIAGFVCFGGITVLSLGQVAQSNASEQAVYLAQRVLGFVPSDSQMELIGIALTLISGLLYALHIVMVNVFGEETHVMPLTFMQYLFAAILAWGAGIIFEQAPNISESFGEIWLSLFYVCVLSTLVAFTFQNIGVKNAPPAFASIILCLESLFGCILSIVFTSETLTFNIAAGAVIIISSIAISEVKISRKKVCEECSRVEEQTQMHLQNDEG